MTGWNSATLADVVDLVIDYRGKTPKKLGSDWCNDGYRALSAKNIKTGQIVQEDAIRFVDEELYCKWMKEEIRRGDILVTSEAPFGQIYYWDSDEKIVLSQRLFAIRIKKEFDARYIYQYMTTPLFYEEMSARATGTTVTGLRQPELMKCKIKYPNIETQKKISAILCTLDMKINVNMLINNNLEQQAQALFDSFITNHQTSSVTVEDLILTANTGADAIQKAPIVDYDTGIRCVRVGDMSNQRPLHEWGFTKVSPEIFNQYQLHKDDIVVTRTASLGLNRLIADDLQAVYNNGLIRITINKSVALPLIVFRQFQTEDFRNYISRITGETSVRPNMKINYLLKYSFEIPSVADQFKLFSLVQPIFDAQEINVSENQSLVSLRDTLLPKLMSGELDVSKINL